MSNPTEILNYQRIVQRMITEELQLDIEAPSLVIWEALQNNFSKSRQTVQDFNYSLKAHNRAYGGLYLTFQLVGEIIREAESKGQSIFEDGSKLTKMEVDSGYSYNDECAIFSRFRLTFQSDTDQTIDSGWGMEDYDTEISNKIVGMYIGDFLWDVFGEDSLYETNFAQLQQLTSQPSIKGIEFPTNIGFSMEHLWTRTKQPYKTWFSNT